MRPFSNFVVAVFFCFAAIAGVSAQANNTARSSELAKEIAAALAPIVKRVDQIDVGINSDDLSLKQLTEFRTELLQIERDIIESSASFLPKISEIDGQIDRLPPLPAAGQPKEPEPIEEQRKVLLIEKAEVTIALKDGELLAVRAGNLDTRVLEARRALFVTSLLQRQPFDTEVTSQIRQNFGVLSGQVGTTLAQWVQYQFKAHQSSLVVLFLALGALAMLLIGGLRPIRKLMKHYDHAEEIPPLQRITFALFSTLLPGAAFAIWCAGLHYMLSYLGLYRLRVDEIIPIILFVITGLVFVTLLLSAILAPNNKAKRLVDISDSAARRLRLLGILMAVIYGLDSISEQLISLYSAPIAFTVINSLLATLLIAMTLIAVVMTRLNEPGDENWGDGYRGWRPLLYWLTWLSILAIVLTGLLGYVSLARFLAGQLIITGSILATMYIGLLASRAIAAQGALEHTRLGKYLSARSATNLHLDQLGLVLSIILNVVIAMVGIPLIMLRWGFGEDDIGSWVYSALAGFSVGGVQISFGRLLLAVIVFVLLLMATRVVQRWFDGKVLARTQLDAGVKNSVRAGLGYIGFFVAALVGISWAGFNLSNIAIIAGALSVGIGFGLQNIVNNFVSGIIMLVERPIKVGDIIQVAGTEGFVRKINVRATELETFERLTVIIPNSEVINTSVGNWMHTDRIRRVNIKIGVAYGSDIEQVREILLACIGDDERIASHPAPFVYFTDFGASSLDFELRFFLRDLSDILAVETDTRFAIDRLFKENGIEIPFPQRDLHVRSAPGLSISSK